MRVAGIMSGTSVDGVDVAIVDIRDGRAGPIIKPVAFHTLKYPHVVREAILAVSNQMTHTATISRLNFLLGEIYSAAIFDICHRKKIPIQSISLLGMHGQTIYHEGAPVEYLGFPIANTLQIGEAAVVAERTRMWVVSNFRERDIAAGGRGAPLVPAVDFLLFRHRRIGRVALNIGGIANITVLPAGATREDVTAFDTGPGNMVIDALVSNLTKGKQTYDRGGMMAKRGKIHAKLLESMLADGYFALRPPKTTGREQFGQEFVSGLLATGLPVEDLIATATELTAQSIARAIQPFPKIREVIASGGGVHNRHLMKRLAALLPGMEMKTSGDFGIDPDAKEAIAFAMLAYEFIELRPGNLPSATGARRAVLLGKGTPVG